MEDLTGKQFGAYRIISPFGEGGMATVYRAFQPSMDRYVALKVLPRFHSSDPEFLGRFEQEARALAQLQHTHILPVYDFGESEGYTYFVMPLMVDGNLAELMADERLSLERIHKVISQVGSALDFAHSRGFIHRDVKPSNILHDESGNCLLMDFGIAKIIEGSKEFTRTGGILGTPAYMSPEQGSGRKIDLRSDIYSLGIILYEMVTGRPPFEAETPVAVIFKHVHDPLPPPSSFNPQLSEEVERVILKSLAKDPGDRYETVREMIDALSRAVTATMLREPTDLDLDPTLVEVMPDAERDGLDVLEREPTAEEIPVETQQELERVAKDEGQVAAQSRNQLSEHFLEPAPSQAGLTKGKMRIPGRILAVSLAVVVIVAGFLIFNDGILQNLTRQPSSAETQESGLSPETTLPVGEHTPVPTLAAEAPIIITPTQEPTSAVTPTSTSGQTEAPIDLGGREVRIAIENIYPPFNFFSTSGVAVGWDYDAWREICDRINCTPIFIETVWNGLFERIIAAEFDVAADGITITDERMAFVTFSDPYMNLGSVVLVRIDETDINGGETLGGLTNKIVGVQRGTHHEIAAIDLVGEERVTSFDTFWDASESLKSGDVDAVIGDAISAADYVNKNPGEIKNAGIPLSSGELLGFVYPNESDLIAPVNWALHQMITDGTLDELCLKWIKLKCDSSAY